MKEKYKVNTIFAETGVTLNELISSFLISFLDKEFNDYGITNTDIDYDN